MKLHPAFSCFVLFFAIFFSCSSNQIPVKAFYGNENTEPVSVEQGNLVGVFNADGTVELFAGVPYAKPPVGNLRWKEPQDPEPWKGTFVADTFAPISMQTRYSALKMWMWNVFAMHDKNGDRTDNAPGSEDCLYLNIWKPAGNKKNLPVLVYIHGGSLTGGSSYYQAYDGEYIAKNDIIQVNIAYRTGIFGFLALDELAQENSLNASGNYGLLDQIKALKWIKKNISAFGGNPDNITIAGESAGSSCVSALCVSPLAKGLFVNAIGESSSVVPRIPPHTFYSFEKAKKISEQVKYKLKVNSVTELRKIPASKLLKFTDNFNGMTIDGYALKEYPWQTYCKGKNNEKALLNGYNKNEAHAFTYFVNVSKKTYPKMLEHAFPNFWLPIYTLLPAENDKQAKEQYEKIFSANAFAYPHDEIGRAHV